MQRDSFLLKFAKLGHRVHIILSTGHHFCLSDKMRHFHALDLSLNGKESVSKSSFGTSGHICAMYGIQVKMNDDEVSLVCIGLLETNEK